jgi:hypothetical protein
MCGPTAPTALRRRSFRSSDRGRGFVFGSSLGRPGEHDDCLARAGPPACWRSRSHEPPRAPPPGGAHGSPHDGVLRDAGAGYDAAFFGMRTSGAQTTTPPGVNVRGERSLHQVRGRPRKDGEHELEPPVAALRSERWVANESLRRCVAMTSETQCLRVSGPARWTSSRGGSTGTPSGMMECGRGASFGRCRSHRDHTRPSLRGSQRSASPGARQGRNTLPSLDVRVEGRRSGSDRQAKRPAKLGGAKRAAASERVRSKAQGSIERARSGNVARNATDSSVEQSLEVDEQSGAPWRHGSGHGSNGEKAHQSVNAIASERTRRGDGMVPGYRGGERFVGYSPQGMTSRGPSGPRPSGRALPRGRAGSLKLGEPHGRLRGATNPQTVERVGLRTCSAAEETVEAGRNGRNGTRSGLGSPEPKSG